MSALFENKSKDSAPPTMFGNRINGGRAVGRVAKMRSQAEAAAALRERSDRSERETINSWAAESRRAESATSCVNIFAASRPMNQSASRILHRPSPVQSPPPVPVPTTSISAATLSTQGASKSAVRTPPASPAQEARKSKSNISTGSPSGHDNNLFARHRDKAKPAAETAAETLTWTPAATCEATLMLKPASNPASVSASSLASVAPVVAPKVTLTPVAAAKAAPTSTPVPNPTPKPAPKPDPFPVPKPTPSRTSAPVSKPSPKPARAPVEIEPVQKGPVLPWQESNSPPPAPSGSSYGDNGPAERQVSIPEKYRIGKVLGVGGHSSVRLATLKSGGRGNFALKEVEKTSSSQEECEMIRREAAILASISHPRVPHIAEFVETTAHLYMLIPVGRVYHRYGERPAVLR
mmetsp:Transcript_99874/g.285530  ORF Transcript_99874/g.285530 Transcript_99874/m.285530 type:complete len:408 (-) Transcript_99874:1495-2718(-)